MNRFQRFALLLCATAFTTLTTSVCAEEITLRGVSAFPKGMALTDDFQRYIDMVNQTGKGVVQIRLVGGPEVTPAAEQGAALGKGVFDVLFGPPTYYAGIFPEADAFAGELLASAKIRAGGGEQLFDQALAKRVNGKLLAFAGGDVAIVFFTREMPKLRPDGTPDLTGLKMRSAPLWNDLFKAMGATPITIPVGEIYTGLERGLVQGITWNLMGVIDAGWNKHLGYIVMPAAYKSSIVITMNLDKWKSIPEAARGVLAKTAVDYENALEAYYVERQAQELKKLDASGVKTFTLDGKGAEAYRKMAFDTMWARVTSNSKVEMDLAAVKKVFYNR